MIASPYIMHILHHAFIIMVNCVESSTEVECLCILTMPKWYCTPTPQGILLLDIKCMYDAMVKCMWEVVTRTYRIELKNNEF